MRRPDLRRGEALRGQRRGDPVDEEIGISRVVDMLELAAAAFGEMAAGRRLHGAGPASIVAVGGDQVARRGHRHEAAALRSRRRRARRGGRSSRRSQAVGDGGGQMAMRSSAIRPGPAQLGGARLEPDAGAGRLERRPARRARIAATMPVSTSPVPALASQGGAGGAIAARPSGAATTVSAPL